MRSLQFHDYTAVDNTNVDRYCAWVAEVPLSSSGLAAISYKKAEMNMTSNWARGWRGSFLVFREGNLSGQGSKRTVWAVVLYWG